MDTGRNTDSYPKTLNPNLSILFIVQGYEVHEPVILETLEDLIQQIR